MIRALTKTLAACLALALPLQTAQAEEPVRAELRPGWRLPNGDHMAALHLSLAPGWKTYWRAPGDAGIPPSFDWKGTRNARNIAVLWPTPHVFWQSGMRSVGYKGDLVLPIRITPGNTGEITLKTEMQMGLCSDICVPHTLRIDATLPAEGSTPDPMIASALASAPFSRGEASVRAVRCSVRPVDGGVSLRAEIDMPRAGAEEEAVVESGQPTVWAAEPQTRREGGTLVTETKLMHMDGKPFMLDRSRLRFTVLGSEHAVDIQGCDS
ncbi:MAG: protein-disulfide reductase DsbD domain-containing protein [Salipiger thiooxidans]|uniref:protein-disulfide reductase DsbD domain-containing protein n=1 Tax=Salipiger thiooxidans TaxID=282683 RepID=UPI001CF943EA|nr:protein-disulfide reductase DsbD domain-containing protein [Salipiger thiooxidans]